MPGPDQTLPPDHPGRQPQPDVKPAPCNCARCQEELAAQQAAVRKDVLARRIAKDPTYPPLRPSVADFAARMEATLKKHDAKKGGQENWRCEGERVMLARLKIEIAELELALIDGTPREAAAEAVDVANFAMMIADCLEPLAEDRA